MTDPSPSSPHDEVKSLLALSASADGVSRDKSDQHDWMTTINEESAAVLCLQANHAARELAIRSMLRRTPRLANVAAALSRLSENRRHRFVRASLNSPVHSEIVSRQNTSGAVRLAIATADLGDLARKWEAAPTLKAPPLTDRTADSSGQVRYPLQRPKIWRAARSFFAQTVFNSLITYIPSHVVRLALLRLMGATIGNHATVMRGTSILGIEYLTIGSNSIIGMRCLLDARAGLWIGSNVTISSDVHVLAGEYDYNHPDFPIVFTPTVIEDYAWIANRAMVLPSLIHRGAVVAAQAVVVKDVGECEVVAGNPARVIGKRDSEALRYNASYRPLFG